MICSSCGFEFNPQLSFCPRCAAPVGAETPPEAPQATDLAAPDFNDAISETPESDTSPEEPVKADESVEEPTGESDDKPIEQPVDEQRDEAVAGPIEGPAEQPVEETSGDAVKATAASGIGNFAAEAKHRAEEAGGHLSELAAEAKHRAEEAGGHISGLAADAKHRAEEAGGHISGLAAEAKHRAEEAGGHLSELAADAKHRLESQLDAAGGIAGIEAKSKKSFSDFIEKASNYSANIIEKLDERRDSSKFWLYVGGATALLILLIILTVR